MLNRRKPAPRIKAAPKRERRRTVHVRSYCRNPVVRGWQKAAQQAKDWGF